jgi:hypothetical protein
MIFGMDDEEPVSSTAVISIVYFLVFLFAILVIAK